MLRSGDRFQTAAVHFKFLHEQDVESAYHLAIYELVAKDGLTEIFNKRKFEEELQRELARAARHQRPLSLIIFDLDEFKAINDTYGHLCGDFILKQIASLARELVRPEQVLARVGGDEFVILAPETGSRGGRGPRLQAARPDRRLRAPLRRHPHQRQLLLRRRRAEPRDDHPAGPLPGRRRGPSALQAERAEPGGGLLRAARLEGYRRTPGPPWSADRESAKPFSSLETIPLKRFLVVLALLALAPALRAEETLGDQHLGYYRYPAIHGDTLVFAAEGDLWRVDRRGGVASRLTTHPAEESNPAISPDGRTLAFSAAYEGPTEVYTMPIDGGLPVRRTFEGAERGGALVAGWTPGGEILYATTTASGLPSTQLARLDPATGRRALIPLAQASEGCYTPDGKTLFFTRFAFQGSHTKRYRGGTAQSLWRFADGETPRPRRSPPTSPAPAGRPWSGRGGSTSSRTATAR